MTESAAPLLLARDREQLDRVVRSIRDERRGFFVIVCAPDLRPAAIRYLAETSGKGIAEPGLVSGHDEMVERMVALDAKAAGSVEGFRIHAADVDVFTALNWHREKVRRAGQVLLWLDSVEGLEALQRHAPDAYSFREGVLVLAGEGGPRTEWEAEEPPDVKTARLLYELPRSPEERAEAASELLRVLLYRGSIDESATIANEAIRLIPPVLYSTERDRLTRAQLYQALALIEGARGRTIEVYRCCRRGILELDPEPSDSLTEFHLWFEAASSSSSVLGGSRISMKRAQGAMDSDPGSWLMLSLRQWAARDAARHGSFRTALDHLDQSLSTHGLQPMEKASTLLARCRFLQEMGHFQQAEVELEGAENLLLDADIPPTFVEMGRAALLRDRAELSAAVVHAARASRATGSMLIGIHWRDRLMAAVRHHDGDVRGAIGAMLERLRTAAVDVRDEHVWEGCKLLIQLVQRASCAGLHLGEDSARSLEGIDSAGRALIEYAAGDPPWYDVLFPGLRASVLSLDPARQAEAITTAAEAISLARSLWPQALPLSTRILVQCLARAARWPDMEPAILGALQCAREADHLIELATVQAYDLVRLLHLAAPRAALEKALADLKSTFSEMDAPRVEGETWLEIAPFFPPLAAFPDPLEIADRAHGLFLDMPMPEPAARCLEWLGDVYVARGASAEASSCYRMSLGTLQRYGLLLRKPLVEKKLAALTGGSLPGPGSVSPGNG